MMAARRGTGRKRLWGRSVATSTSVAAGVTLSGPLGINMDPDELNEGTLVRVVVSQLGAEGSLADHGFFGIILADEDAFPTTISAVSSTDADWMFRTMVRPVVTANINGSERRDFDIRAQRRLREQDREPYFVFTADPANGGAMVVSFAVQALFLLK